MKSRRTQRHIKPKKPVVDKSSLTLAKPKSCVSYPAQAKPFIGKVFYLDLPSNRKAESLENDIKDLGGTVEKFFSKEIKYLVSNKREAKYAQCLRRDSPVPSPDSGHSSPHPHLNTHRPRSQTDKLKCRTQGQTDTVSSHRGKSLVEKVVKEQERIQMDKILSNALEWGVKILYVDDIKAYVEKKKKNVTSQCTVPAATVCFCPVGRISKPFVKVEDSSRHYRPIYLAMTNMPEFNLRTVAPCSPFFVKDKDHSGKRQRGDRYTKKNRDKKRGGYCECCKLKYDNLTLHLKSQCHKAFSKSDEYLMVDKLVSTLHCNFINVKTKCSVSSVVITGPCGKIEQRHEGDIDTTEAKEEQQSLWADSECGEFSLGHSLLKHSSAPGSAPVIHGEADSRNCASERYQDKHKSLARKRPCRHDDTMNTGTFTAEMVQTSIKAETAPSRGVSFTSNPAFQADPKDQRTHRDKKCSTSHSHKDDLQNEFPSNSLNGASSRRQVSIKTEDSSLKESLQDEHIVPKGMTGVLEREGGNFPTQSHSPVRTIQRRVRVYKRKRRKVDLRDFPENSLLELWQLFQSSEDTDTEFLGFAD
uniref:Protein DBF4 homolog A n=1 Tax=Myripristis murdjan TaxID=586833 RepID=A0A667ZAC9_9TELE